MAAYLGQRATIHAGTTLRRQVQRDILFAGKKRASLPLREGVREDLFYQGDHGKLMGFLTECRSHGCEPLSETRFQELSQSVENLSRQETRGVNLKQEHFQGASAMLSKKVLGHLCIPTRSDDDGLSPKNFPAQRSPKGARLSKKPSSSGRSSIATEQADEEVVETQSPKAAQRESRRISFQLKSGASECEDEEWNGKDEDEEEHEEEVAADDTWTLNNKYRTSSHATSYATDVMEDEIVNREKALWRPELENDIFMVTYAFSKPMDLFGNNKIKAERFAGWLLSIAAQYYAMPYHNWQHAMDVFFFSMFAVNMGRGDRFLTFQDIMALYVASLAHDVGHLGVNNNFLVNTRSRLATIYNDESVLENMHASKCFETMRIPGKDFLETLSFEDYNNFRSSVISSILATDMAKHYEFVDHLGARVSKKEKFPFAMDLSSQEGREHCSTSKADRKLLLQAFLHLADLGSNCKSWQFCWKVVVALEEEVFAQGDRERDLALPICPLGDRTKDSMGSAQDFFLMKIVRPLLEPCTEFLSEEVSGMLVGNLQSNRLRWMGLLTKHGKRSAAELAELANQEQEEEPAAAAAAVVEVASVAA